MPGAPALPRPSDMVPVVSGPYVALALVVALELLWRMGVSLPDPSLFLLMAVVYSVYSGGVPSGVVTSGVVVAFGAAFFAVPGQAFVYAGSGGESLVALAVASVATVGMMGWLQRRARRLFEVEAANARLKELDAQRSQAIGTAALELATPLAPIREQLEALKSRGASLEPPLKEGFAHLERNVGRIEAVAQDLLEVARFQAGFTPLERERIDLGEVVREAAGSFREAAQEAGIDLELAVPGPGEVEVFVDPRRVVQVMFNLLGNAIHFTPRGGRVRVEARLAGGMGLVRVADTGQGIAPEGLQRLFHPFVQVHEGGPEPLGTGLGLFISKGLVELHGGQIWAESEGPGKGSAFTFTLPLAGAERAEQGVGVAR